MTPDHTTIHCGAVVQVELEMVSLPGNSSHRSPREGSGSLSMQPVGCTLWCSTDTVVLWLAVVLLYVVVLWLLVVLWYVCYASIAMLLYVVDYVVACIS